MDSKRFYYVLVGSMALLVIAAFAGVYFGHQTLTGMSVTLSQQKAKAAALESQERSLILAKKDITEYEELRDIAKSIVPQEKDQARTVRELVAIADSLGISISNISFPTSNLGEKAKKKDSSAGGISQVEPVEGIAGLYELPVDVTTATEVEYQTLVGFLERLENNRRTSTISSITITPGSSEQLLSFGLTLKVFIKP